MLNIANRRGLLATSKPSSLLTSLVAYWKLDDLTDATGRGNTLTNGGSATFAAGKIGNAVNLVAASTQFLSANDNADLSMPGTSFSIAGWVRLASLASMAAVAKYNFTASHREYQIVYTAAATNRFQFLISNDGTATVSVTANNFGAAGINTWYFVNCWLDIVAQTINIQVNNGAVDSAPCTVTVLDSTSNFNIGARDNGASLFWDGLIDEVGIWKKVLSASEVTTLYNGSAGKSYPF